MKVKFLAVFILGLLGLLGVYAVNSIRTVQAGYVGVKVHLLGSSKGVENEVLGVGRYWIGWNQDLFLFPTFQQTTQWIGSDNISFQTREGLGVSVDVGISYQLDPEKIAVLFQKYRKGIDEITNVYLKAIVRDAFVQIASNKTIEDIYGEGKSRLIDEVRAKVTEKMGPLGVIMDYVSIIGQVHLPKNVTDSINAKIEATQKAQQRQNELAQAQAEAEKLVAEAEGQKRAAVASAEGEARAIEIKAKAQAEANILLAKSLTDTLIQYRAIEKWNGLVPAYIGGGAVPFFNMNLEKAAPAQ